MCSIFPGRSPVLMKIMEASARRNNCMSSILMSLGRHRCFIIHSACILHRLVRSRMQLNWKNTRWYNAFASCTHIILFYTRRSSLYHTRRGWEVARCGYWEAIRLGRWCVVFGRLPGRPRGCTLQPCDGFPWLLWRLQAHGIPHERLWMVWGEL